MRQLSHAAGASPAVVYQIERGLIAKPSAEIAVRLAKALGTTVDFLIFGDGEPPDAAQVKEAFSLVAPVATGTEG